MAYMLKQVLYALDRLGAVYSLGGESLLGFAEGDIAKYQEHIHLYLFRLPVGGRLRLFLMLLPKGIFVKPKLKRGQSRLKIRIRTKRLKKHPSFIMITPVHMSTDSASVHSGGRDNHYELQDLNPDKLQKLWVENIPVIVPREFESFVRKYSKQLLTVSYNQQPWRLTPEIRQKAHELLRSSCEILEDLGIHYWLDFGTLLGFIRDNKLIDWDHDMDLSIRYDSDEQMEQMIRALAKRYPVRVLKPSLRSDTWKLGNYRTIKVYCKKYGFIKTKFYLDLFTQYRGRYGNNGADTYRAIVCGNNSEIPASFVDELDTFLFQGHEYKIPNHTEDFLALRYGDDWRTPKKEWYPPLDDRSMVQNDEVIPASEE